MKKAKKISLLITLIIALCIALLSAVNCFASNTEATALTVQLNGETKKSFTLAELQAIADSENNAEYSFSCWNTYPTHSIKTVTGPSVEGILKAAGVWDSITDDGTVSFSDTQYIRKLTGYQLTKEKRYYYPNGKQARPGYNAVPEAARNGRAEVPEIICLDDQTCLYIGQVEPNEENKPVFVQGIAKGGIINVSTETAKKCSTIKATKPDEFVEPEEKISLVNGSGNDEYYDKIYYTIDGSTPGYASAVYNNGPQSDEVSKPYFGGSGETPRQEALKVVVKGYGKLDSDVTEVKFTVCKHDIKHTTDKSIPYVTIEKNSCEKCGYEYKTSAESKSFISSFKLSRANGGFTAAWTKQSGTNQRKFSGYQIRYSKKANMSGVAWRRISKTKASYTARGLKKNTLYYVQMRTYITSGKGVYYSKAISKTIRIR